MARLTPFRRIVEMTRNEARISTNPSRGVDNLDYIKQLVTRHYETLADEYDWAFLTVRKEDALKALQKGERYYDFPAQIDQRYATEAWVWWGNVYMKLKYGITPMEYSALNSHNPATMIDPILKWQIRDDKQFEVWPPPASNGQISTRPYGYHVAFEGKRKFSPMVQDGDPCDLDDQLIALYASAEILEQQQKGSGAVKLALAKSRMEKLRAMGSHHERVRVGMGTDDNRNDGMSPGFPRIRVFPSSN